MKKILFVICLMAGIICILSWTKKPAKKKLVPKLKITGSIMQTMSYCGGAMPTDEILKRFATPAGIPFGKLFIRKSETNKSEAKIIDSIIADKNGNFSISLLKGNYCIIEEWKSKPYKVPLNNATQKVDAACYRKLYDACDYELTITDSNIHHQQFVFHRPCYSNKPCISYSGPLRP